MFDPQKKGVCQLLWQGRFIDLVLNMELFFTRYKRVLISLGLSLLFLVSGEVCISYNLSVTGLLFTILSAAVLGYLVVFWILNKTKKQPFSLAFTRYELLVIPIISISVCVSGLVESYPNKSDFTAVFTLLLLYIFLYVVIRITNYIRISIHKAPLSRSFLNKVMFWAFAIGVGRIVLLIEEYGDTDALIFVAFVYFPLLFFLIARWIFKQTRAIIELKNEKAKTELLHLKSQVNPHFFFNMLNNLYGLVGTDAKKAQELILKLSDMMRYSIYEGEKELVTLEEEVAYLENYIDLHKMRYHKDIAIEFTHSITENHKVMPLLFIILLENAFKHGVENLRKDAFINMAIKTEGDSITFKIENNFDPTEIPNKPGIGLKNLKRRLELGYLNKHSLSFASSNNIYKVELTLQKL